MPATRAHRHRSSGAVDRGRESGSGPLLRQQGRRQHYMRFVQCLGLAGRSRHHTPDEPNDPSSPTVYRWRSNEPERQTRTCQQHGTAPQHALDKQLNRKPPRLTVAAGQAPSHDPHPIPGNRLLLRQADSPRPPLDGLRGLHDRQTNVRHEMNHLAGYHRLPQAQPHRAWRSVERDRRQRFEPICHPRLREVRRRDPSPTTHMKGGSHLVVTSPAGQLGMVIDRMGMVGNHRRCLVHGIHPKGDDKLANQDSGSTDNSSDRRRDRDPVRQIGDRRQRRDHTGENHDDGGPTVPSPPESRTESGRHQTTGALSERSMTTAPFSPSGARGFRHPDPVHGRLPRHSPLRARLPRA